MDSARIHGADATWDVVYGLLESKNIQLIWIPKYSPEFNPVELFWRYLKVSLRIELTNELGESQTSTLN
jgi:transposase